MINIKLYTVQGLVPVKKDAHGGNQLGWKKVYGQMNNTTFEYTTNREQAILGDFNFQIPNCKVIYQAKKKENIVKIIQQVRGKAPQDPKYVELKVDEAIWLRQASCTLVLNLFPHNECKENNLVTTGMENVTGC